MSYPTDFAVEEEVTAADMNKIKNVPLVFGNGGETITVSGNPLPVYQNESDGEFYRSDGNDTSKLRVDGFLLSSTSNGNPAVVQVGGIVDGFTGLTSGTPYYLQDDGTIGTTHGTYQVPVGIARSSTRLEIWKPKSAAGVCTTLSGTGDSTDDEQIRCGFKPSVIRVNYYVQGHDQATETSKYKKVAGIAAFYGMTNKGYNWQLAASTGDASSDLDMINNDTNSHGTMQNPNSGAGGASAGNQGANGGIVASFSLLSLNVDGFTIRKSLDAGSGNSSTGIVRLSWEAYA